MGLDIMGKYTPPTSCYIAPLPRNGFEASDVEMADIFGFMAGMIWIHPGWVQEIVL